MPTHYFYRKEYDAFLSPSFLPLLRQDGRTELLEMVEFDESKAIAGAATHRLGGFLRVVCVKTDSKLFEWLRTKRVVIPFGLDVSLMYL